ncbi:MAG: T9SS type A sorting domain-containing protein [Saprospiraceae bacterium]|nr:T9SS type A sorting domain-containing protein [Saprospiraceae bacterium]
MNIKSYLALICLFPLSSVFAQTGSLDDSFNGNGYVLSSILSNYNNVATHVAVQVDGKILAGIAVYGPGLDEYTVIQRYLEDGSLDQTFNGSGQITLKYPGKEVYLSDILNLPNGKFLVAANIYNTNNAHYTPALFRFLANGALDAGFGTNGVMQQAAVNGYTEMQFAEVDVLPDGKLIVAGYITPNEGAELCAVFRYQANGALDTGFHGDGIATVALGTNYVSVSTLVIDSNGKILIGGTYTGDTNYDFMAIRMHANGTLDNGFNGDGIAIFALTDQDDQVTGMALQSDGKIVLGGYARDMPGVASTDFAVMRLTTDGNLDPTYSEDGSNIVSVGSGNDAAYTMVMQPDGKVVLAGYISNNTGGADFAMARFTTNGNLDNTFSGDGKVVVPIVSNNTDAIYAVALQPDGKIVAAGIARTGDNNSFVLARFISGVLVGTQDTGSQISETLLYPNPLKDQAQLEYHLESATDVSINLYDVQGKLIQNLLAAVPRGAGIQRETLYFNKVPAAGTYLLRIETGGGIKQMKVVVMQ